jgi:GrpB-like predicted nucleotidyltransferase (UPF0157 family)
LLEYDSGWALRFEELAARVRAFLGDSVCHVEHIGSTAVPGLTAKPVIDLDVAVRSAIDVPPAFSGLHRPVTCMRETSEWRDVRHFGGLLARSGITCIYWCMGRRSFNAIWHSGTRCERTAHFAMPTPG